LEEESGKTDKTDEKMPRRDERWAIETAHPARRCCEGHLKAILEDKVVRGPQPMKKLKRLPIASQEKMLAVIHHLFRRGIDEGTGAPA
jgi:hypothetical protein